MKDAASQLMAELSAIGDLLDAWLQAKDPAAYLDTIALLSLLANTKAFRLDLETCGERIKEAVRSWHKGMPECFGDQEIHHLGLDHIDGR